MADINRAREILKSLPEEQRKEFIGKYNELSSEENRGIAISRLVSKFGGGVDQQVQESQTQPQQSTQVNNEGGAVATQERDVPKSENLLADIGGILKKNAIGGLKHTYTEGVSPVLSGLSTAAFGLPKALINKINPELKEKMFPEQQTVQGKVNRGAAELLGMFTGGAAKLATKATKLVKGASKGSTVLKGILGGATYGASQNVGDDIDSLKERGIQAGAGALAGGALAGIGSSMSGIKKVWDKSKPGYIVNKVAKNAHEVFKKNVDKFDDGMQAVAAKLKIPSGAINTIKKKGVGNLKQARKVMGDTTDTIYQRMQEGIKNKVNEAGAFYDKAYNKIPSRANINLNDTHKRMGQILKKYKLLDAKGNPTKYASDASLQDSTQRKLLDVYGRLKSRVRTGNIKLSKPEYRMLRDNLNSLYKETPSDVDLSMIMKNYYNDGEKAGMTGLNKAREMFSKAKRVEKQFINKVGDVKGFKESKLNRFHEKSFTEVERRWLKSVESHIGDKNLIEDLGDLTAAKYLDKFDNINLKTFQKDLHGAIDPTWTKTTLAEYKDLIGEKEAQKVFKEIMAHRKAKKVLTTGKVVAGIGTAEGARRLIIGGLKK